MIKKIIFIGLVLIVLFFISLSFSKKKTSFLANPSVSPLPSAEINQPKEIKYDSSTDLKKELETVNPQVLDSDFEE